MNRLSLFPWGAIMSLVLVACQQPVKPDAANPHYVIPVGSTVVLHQPVEVGPHTASLYIQGGQSLRATDVEILNGYCILQVQQVLDKAQPIKPDTFRVYRVRRNIMEVSRQPVVRLAALGMMIADGPTQVFYSTEMMLQSDKQPQVRSLTCEWDQANSRSLVYAEYMSIRDMRIALGEIATLRVAGPAP